MVLAKITIWSEIWWSASLVHMIKWCENDFLKFTLFDLQNQVLKILGAQILLTLSDKCDFEGQIM